MISIQPKLTKAYIELYEKKQNWGMVPSFMDEINHKKKERKIC